MKAIISTTYDDKYLFFWPIVAYCWDKLNVGTICFAPEPTKPNEKISKKMSLIADTFIRLRLKNEYLFYKFSCPEHKEATYAQCSRLYASALDLPENEILITSDVDMALFKIPQNAGGHVAIFGHDLTPPKQVPICYISADVKEWRRIFKVNGRSYQQCLDDMLGGIECENMRGNYWAADQEEAYNKMLGGNGHSVLLPRANPGTQFATNRVDRDDINWRSYCGPDLIDAHLWRPGYEENNFANILELLQIQYPEENFQWLIDYRTAYLKLL